MSPLYGPAPMAPRPSVLVVDADGDFVGELGRQLTAAGIDVVAARDGRQALECFAGGPPDAVVLDLDLPGLPGLDVCRQVRSMSDVPIVVATSRADEVDTALAFELGADGYVLKPCAPYEVVVRLRTLLARAGRARTGGVLRAGRVEVDAAAHRVTLDGRTVNLTLKEFHLLQVLVDRAGKVVTRRSLLDTVWGRTGPGDATTLDAHVKRLRAKLGESAADSHITTVRGVGGSRPSRS